ncbi:MAG: glucose-6-phosphate dehydrogenase [Microbacteriaceae bacterium]|jgi:glucose-6-phosphate 1-dehydrogenase|nr:glucose-6-phosphate dehydrogenase [Microbacteriaceae bacterium]MCI1207764.1 glucose-6-phosphate dehydrogenase [Microbacteriaceae bacterium]
MSLGFEGMNPLRRPEDLRLTRIAGPSAIVFFGVTGDLARNKLLPAVYDLANRGLLSPGFGLVGFGRREWSRDDFIAFVEKSVRAHARTPFRPEVFAQLARGLRFVTGTFDDPAAYDRIRETLDELRRTQGTLGNTAFYLSIPPAAFPVVCGQLNRAELTRATDDSWRRVVIEKPFGSDLQTARRLNSVVEEVFDSDQIFRIDHYLGKETVQNLLAVRFANAIFEPLWNGRYVDHVQITMAEDIGIGTRAGYYDGIGAARDVIQNHLLQLLALTAMEEPADLSAASLRAEKEKALGSVVVPADLAARTARGQYAAGWQGSSRVRGYLEEDGIPEDSITETFAALELHLENRRWQGVPFFLRAGKRLGRRVTEIALVFKRTPQTLFPSAQSSSLGPNALVIRIQPDEGVTLRFGSKVPGAGMQVRDVTMDFGYGHAFTVASPEAYERLILDVLLGDPPLFPRHREVELSWEILDPIEQFWARGGRPEPYAPGSWGPESANRLITRTGRTWRRP